MRALTRARSASSPSFHFRIFDHPRDVLNDPDLTIQEKRAILSSWAPDACAVEEMPALRQPPAAKRPVTFDEIVDALRSLDDDPDRQRRGGLAIRSRDGAGGATTKAHPAPR